MAVTETGRARAVADLAEGLILGSVEISAPPERVFRALSSEEVVDWWVRAGVFNTTEWIADLHVGGRWRASGTARGKPYVFEGEFLEIDSPRTLVQTYGTGAPWGPTTLRYELEGLDGATRVTLRHSGFTSREACANFAIGWETSFERLAEILAS